MAKGQQRTPERIMSKLREADVKLANGAAIAQACKDLVITGQTCYRHRKEYGGPKLDRARRRKPLEGEDARLKRLLAESARPARRGTARRDRSRGCVDAGPRPGTYGRAGRGIDRVVGVISGDRPYSITFNRVVV